MGPFTLCGGYNHSPKQCFKGEHNINDIMEKMILTAINHSLAVYIPKGEHDDPMNSPNNKIRGFNKNRSHIISYVDIITPTPNSAQKLKYICGAQQITW